MRERRVDLERLARLLHLLLLAEVLDRAQVVQAVGELDQDHPHVLGHRHDQLAVVLGLGVLAALELDARQLRDALDELRDLVAELGAQLLDRRCPCPRRRRGAAPQRASARRAGAREDLGGTPRVVDELLPRLAHLAGVGVGGEVERARQQLPVDVGLVRLDLGDQLVDEILMSLQYCHRSSVPRPFRRSIPRSRDSQERVVPMNGGAHVHDDGDRPRSCSQIARLLRELDAAAPSPRSA